MSEHPSPPASAAPGSPEAVAKGCTCPIRDNARGTGYMGMPGQYWVTAGCPLHGVKGSARLGDDP